MSQIPDHNTNVTSQIPMSQIPMSQSQIPMSEIPMSQSQIPMSQIPETA